MSRLFPESDSPLPLPLGMRLTQLVTRNRSNCDTNFCSQPHIEYSKHLQNSNANHRVNRDQKANFGQEIRDWRMSKNEKVLINPYPMMGNSGRRENMFSNRGFLLPENLKKRSTDMYKHLCGWSNAKRITNKSLVYYELYSREQKKLKEHRDIENFQRLYIDNYPRSTMAGQRMEKGYDENFNPLSQLENRFEGALAESRDCIPSSNYENRSSRYIMRPSTPSTNSEHFASRSKDSVLPKMCDRNERTHLTNEVLSTEELFRKECGVDRKSTASVELSDEDGHLQYSPSTPGSIFEATDAVGTTSARYSDAGSPNFAHSPFDIWQNVSADERSIRGRALSNLSREFPTNIDRPNTRTRNYANEEWFHSSRMNSGNVEDYSTTPERQFVPDAFSDSPVIFSQNSNENWKTDNTQQYSFLDQNVPHRTPPTEQNFHWSPERKNLAPLISYPENDGETVIVEKFRV